MKRRELFKFLGAIAAVPFVAPLVAMCKPKMIRDAYIECARPLFSLTKNDDLFGDDRYLLERTGQQDSAVREGLSDHLRSGLSVYSPPIAQEAVNRGTHYSYAIGGEA